MGASERGRCVGKIEVTVVNARNLENNELLSKSDPYCKVCDTYVTCRGGGVQAHLGPWPLTKNLLAMGLKDGPKWA